MCFDWILNMSDLSIKAEEKKIFLAEMFAFAWRERETCELNSEGHFENLSNMKNLCLVYLSL